MDQAADRAAALNAVLNSAAAKKLIVAGPGTGKSHTFKEVLNASPAPNLAITFINALAEDLGQALGDRAETHTFHGFCKGLLHRIVVDGLTADVDYYPSFLELAADDHNTLNPGAAVTPEQLASAIRRLDDTAGHITAVISSGDVYDAVGHDDSVYRVLRHLRDQPAWIPRFSQIVVDEYQDFNLLEVSLIEVLAQASPVLIVGDDDQSLYDFKDASSDYIRALAQDEEYETFSLPYCSRCTQVLVAATHTVVERAQASRLLVGRLDKRYECYLPDKAAESQRYPTITHARCSVERGNAPYIERYIEREIAAIPAADIAKSQTGGYPTVLVTGPRQFTARIYEYLRERYTDITYKPSTDTRVELLDGYERLAKNSRSRLGWRIVTYLDRPGSYDALIPRALRGGENLADLVPSEYRQRQLHLADLVRRLTEEETLADVETHELESALGAALIQIRERLRLEETQVGDIPQLAAHQTPTEPSITLTSLVGSKGLQAEHVFIVGLNEGHFPQHNTAVTDNEVCKLLVALTRAKQHCTVISCDRFGAEPLGSSVFLEWLAPHLDRVRVDKAYFRQNT